MHILMQNQNILEPYNKLVVVGWPCLAASHPASQPLSHSPPQQDSEENKMEKLMVWDKDREIT